MTRHLGIGGVRDDRTAGMERRLGGAGVEAPATSQTRSASGLCAFADINAGSAPVPFGHDIA